MRMPVRLARAAYARVVGVAVAALGCEWGCVRGRCAAQGRRVVVRKEEWRILWTNGKGSVQIFVVLIARSA